jgi:ABC-type sulfate transport system permease component
VKNLRINPTFRRTSLLLVLCAVLALPLAAFGQSCALCYTQAASSGQKMIRALRDGILILVIPPTLASVGMLFIIHRKRNQIRRMDSAETSRLDW